MIEVLLVWTVTTMVALYHGEWVSAWLSGLLKFRSVPNFWGSLWIGFAFMSSLIGVLCLFTPLIPGVKLLMWLGLLAPVLYQYGWLAQKWMHITLHLKAWSPVSWLIFSLTASIALIKSAGVPEIFDEGAYHLPLIRMWEQQGLVIGMANLNGHYGLNSVWHVLSGFANLTFIPGWHTALPLNGLVISLLGAYSAQNAKGLHSTPAISSWIIVFLPVLVFRNVISSPSTDIPAIVAAWFLFTLWLKNLEYNKDWREIWPMLVVVPFWILMLKSSSAALLLIPAGLVVRGVRTGQVRQSLLLAMLGMLFVLPWLLGNWLLTGYLVFPVQATAFLHPEWQIPTASIEAKFYLEQFGMFAPPKKYTFQWLITWFSAHNKDTRVLLILSGAGLLSFVFWIRKRKDGIKNGVLLFGTVAACLLVWLLTITEPRYGFGALVFSALFPLGWLAMHLQSRISWTHLLIWMVVMAQVFNLYKTTREADWKWIGWWHPAPRPLVSFRALQCLNFKGITPIQYRTPVPAGKPPFCWDCPFPCIPKEGAIDSLHIVSKTILGHKAFVYK